MQNAAQRSEASRVGKYSNREDDASEMLHFADLRFAPLGMTFLCRLLFNLLWAHQPTSPNQWLPTWD